jgi:hypothetical protein
MGYSDADDAEDLTTPTVDDMVTGGDIPNNRAVHFDDLQTMTSTDRSRQPSRIYDDCRSLCTAVPSDDRTTQG